MFNQEVKYRFSTLKNERLFEFLITPGTPWDDIYEVLSGFSDEFKKLQETAAANEALAKANSQPIEAVADAPQGE
jgi:hypothetical protein